MKKLRTRPWGRAIATLALTATTAQATNFAASTQQIETIVALASNPPPTPPTGTVTGFVLVTGQAECDAGSIAIRLGAEPETPGLTLFFHKGEAQLAADGEAPTDVSEVTGNGVFDFRLSIRHLAQPVRTCQLEIRKQGGKFETVARLAWPTPLLPSQEPLAWLATGATAGLAGSCSISNFAMAFVTPGSRLIIH